MPDAAAITSASPLIRSVAVIGAGERGRAFALRCAAGGFATVLQDVLSSKLRKAEEQLAVQPATVGEALRLSGSIEDAVRDADLAIDFVPDELESKLEIFSLLDRMAPPKTIFCTPTRLSISDLASCTYRAGRCVALFSAPDTSSHELEVIRGEKTDEAVLVAVNSWLRELGFHVAVSLDSDAPVGSMV